MIFSVLFLAVLGASSASSSSPEPNTTASGAHARAESGPDDGLIAPIYSPPLECYVCRSDRHKDCVYGVSSSYLEECTLKNSEVFLDDLINNPPKKPVPNYKAGRQGGDFREWACYSQVSSDKTFALRSCTIVQKSQEAVCNRCKVDGSSAKCCMCRESACNKNIGNSILRGHSFYSWTGRCIIPLMILTFLNGNG